MNSLVSVILPCFNQGRFLSDAIKSLQAQTYPYWEAIIVNDGSCDETAEVASTLSQEDGRIRYIAKQNGGLSSARNAGIRVCKGDFIQFLDADDQLETEKLEKHVSFLQDQRDVDLVYGNAVYFYDGAFGKFDRGPYGDDLNHDWISEWWNDPRPVLTKLIERNLFPVCSPLLRRTAIEMVGLFNEDLEALEDWEYWIRCAAAGVRFQYIDAVFTEAMIRRHSASMSKDLGRLRRAGFWMRLFCHESLLREDVRSVNLKYLLVANRGLGKEGRLGRYYNIAQVCHSWKDRVLILMYIFRDIVRPLRSYANRLMTFLSTKSDQ